MALLDGPNGQCTVNKKVVLSLLLTTRVRRIMLIVDEAKGAASEKGVAIYMVAWRPIKD